MATSPKHSSPGDQLDPDALASNPILNLGIYLGTTPADEHVRHVRMASFIEAVGLHGRSLKAAKAVGVPYSLLWIWKARYPEFAEAWEAAKVAGLEAVEDELHRRAVEGIERPLTWRGERTGHFVTEYSDRLLEFELKALDPERYREHPIVKTTTQVLVIQAEGLMPARAELDVVDGEVVGLLGSGHDVEAALVEDGDWSDDSEEIE